MQRLPGPTLAPSTAPTAVGFQAATTPSHHLRSGELPPQDLRRAPPTHRMPEVSSIDLHIQTIVDRTNHTLQQSIVADGVYEQPHPEGFDFQIRNKIVNLKLPSSVHEDVKRDLPHLHLKIGNLNFSPQDGTTETRLSQLADYLAKENPSLSNEDIGNLIKNFCCCLNQQTELFPEILHPENPDNKHYIQLFFASATHENPGAMRSASAQETTPRRITLEFWEDQLHIIDTHSTDISGENIKTYEPELIGELRYTRAIGVTKNTAELTSFGIMGHHHKTAQHLTLGDQNLNRHYIDPQVDLLEHQLKTAVAAAYQLSPHESSIFVDETLPEDKKSATETLLNNPLNIPNRLKVFADLSNEDYKIILNNADEYLSAITPRIEEILHSEKALQALAQASSSSFSNFEKSQKLTFAIKWGFSLDEEADTDLIANRLAIIRKEIDALKNKNPLLLQLNQSSFQMITDELSRIKSSISGINHLLNPIVSTEETESTPEKKVLDKTNALLNLFNEVASDDNIEKIAHVKVDNRDAFTEDQIKLIKKTLKRLKTENIGIWEILALASQFSSLVQLGKGLNPVDKFRKIGLTPEGAAIFNQIMKKIIHPMIKEYSALMREIIDALHNQPDNELKEIFDKTLLREKSGPSLMRVMKGFADYNNELSLYNSHSSIQEYLFSDCATRRGVKNRGIIDRLIFIMNSLEQIQANHAQLASSP
jgi:hypothetical protein